MQTDHIDSKIEQPFQPEIPRSRYALGMTSTDQVLEQLPLGRFSDGQRTLPSSAAKPHRGRFSEGQERLGEDDPEKHIRRRYSEGLESQSFLPS